MSATASGGNWERSRGFSLTLNIHSPILRAPDAAALTGPACEVLMDPILAVTAASAAEDARNDQLRSRLLEAGSVEAWLTRAGRPDTLIRYPPSVRATGWDEPGYPEGLRELKQPPPALFVIGSRDPLPPPKACVAIIGARRCTDVGRWVARDLAAGLAERGVVVVSGLALGVDAAAHEGALDAGGGTLAVLAGPVDRPGPVRNLHLAQEIACGRGWLVSERPPRARVLPAEFPRRNRLVAALASVVVVVEAGVRSGTLSTVTRALSLGREVAAVPGPVTSPASAGANALIAAGAHLVTCAEDVLAIVGQARERWNDARGLDADERAVLKGLPAASGSPDRWVEASGLQGPKARAALARLLTRGALRRLSGGRIARVL